ncbi:MAG: hypothetical protein Q8Q52_04375 [Acidimicrobiia bacterium]|nr:hypothetical protein [Acidimicrobiia bacterium]
MASGVDALYLSAWAELPDELLGRLERSKARAQAVREAVRFSFGDIDFALAPYGVQKYEYWLSHEYGALGVSSKKSIPPLRWQPRSELLHGIGVESALDALGTVTEAEVGLFRFTVSRLDLYSDWQGWDVGLLDETRFVRRARHVAVDLDGDAWTGFTFGRRRSGTIGGRIYDKTAEIAAGKGNPMWFEIWKERYVPDSSVIRVEFEFHRQALFKEFGLDTPEEVLANLGGLWGHATESWLTHRDLTGDFTRSRLPISGPWASIQQPSFRENAIGLDRATRGKGQAELENILPVLRGCFTSASAQWGVDGMVEGLGKFAEYLHAWELATGRSVDGEIAVKRQKKDWGL